MATFEEGYKGDWGRAVQSNVLVGDMFGQIVRNEIVKSFHVFSLRKWKVHMGMNIINFNENYSTGTIAAFLIEQQTKRHKKLIRRQPLSWQPEQVE